MILLLVLIAVLCIITVAAAYDTSGDKHINHEIAAAHVQGRSYDELAEECRANVDGWASR